MRPRAHQTRTSVCQLCNFIAGRNPVRPGPLQYTNHTQVVTTARRTLAQKQEVPLKSNTRRSKSNEELPRHRIETRVSATTWAQGQIDINEELREVVQKRDELTARSSIPTEVEVRTVLTYCEAFADALIEPADQISETKDGSAISALLSVEEQAAAKPVPKPPQLLFATNQKYIDRLSSIAHSILIHPTVFITPQILQEYVDLQSRLKKPENLPSIFKLYPSKPVPKEGSSPIKFKEQNPNKVANAININVADKALQAAIDAKQLGTAMEIVDAAYATKAFRRSKFAKKGLIPATSLAVAPVAIYSLASHLSSYQSTMDPAMATNIAFAGILAYVGFTTTIGVVAVTTANDQMDRVTWIPGMPLRERWIREEERAAIDRIAGAWGFREKWRRGEEEGEEWEALREWIGRKGMILDRTELMEGME